MKGFECIKNHYKPIQPSVKTGNEKVIYEEVRPSKELENFVFCFWQLKSKVPLDQPFVYRVVSDGCVDIFFNHREPSENFIMGFCRKFTTFSIGCEFAYIGIRFLPSIFPLLFGINARSLSDETLELKHILPKLSSWITIELRPSYSFEKITGLLNNKLTVIVAYQSISYDDRLYRALSFIFQKNGYLDTEKELNTGLSSRQLRRIFNYYLGTTAKTFSNVVRFQYILNAKPSNQSLKENKIYYDVGFFDQAHFIKNFKAFYGITPSEAFR